MRYVTNSNIDSGGQHGEIVECCVCGLIDSLCLDVCHRLSALRQNGLCYHAITLIIYFRAWVLEVSSTSECVVLNLQVVVRQQSSLRVITIAHKTTFYSWFDSVMTYWSFGDLVAV